MDSEVEEREREQYSQPITPEVTTLYRGEPRGIRAETTDVPFTLDKVVAEVWAGKEGRVVSVNLSNEEIAKLRFSMLPDRGVTYYLPQDLYKRAMEAGTTAIPPPDWLG